MIATASPANHDWLRELGAEPLDYNDPDVPARVREVTGDGGADAAIDLFGGDGREQAFASLRSGGRLISIASPPPEKRDDVETHYVFVRPSGVDLRELAEAVDAGHLRPHIEETFPLSAPTRTSASRAATCAASSCSAFPEDQRPDRAQQRERRAQRLDGTDLRPRLGLVVRAPDQPGLVEVGEIMASATNSAISDRTSTAIAAGREPPWIAPHAIGISASPITISA